MIGRLGRAVVLLFAVLGFVCVPLGHRTGFEHLVAILKTGAAADTGRDLVQAAARLRAQLLAALHADRGGPHTTGATANRIEAPRRAARDAGPPDASVR